MNINKWEHVNQAIWFGFRNNIYTTCDYNVLSHTVEETFVHHTVLNLRKLSLKDGDIFE